MGKNKFLAQGSSASIKALLFSESRQFTLVNRAKKGGRDQQFVDKNLSKWCFQNHITKKQDCNTTLLQGVSYYQKISRCWPFI